MDFGCGVSLYRAFIHYNKYYRVDYEKIFELDDKTIDEIIFYNGKDIPLSDVTQDGIISTEVFEHAPDLDEIIKEFKRVLKDGGYALISIPFTWGEHNAPYDYQRLTSYGIKYLFEKHGFEVIHLEKTTRTIHTITQLITAEIRNRILSGIPIIRQIINLLFFFPIQLMGLIIGFLIPDKQKVLLSIL